MAHCPNQSFHELRKMFFFFKFPPKICSDYLGMLSKEKTFLKVKPNITFGRWRFLANYAFSENSNIF